MHPSIHPYTYILSAIYSLTHPCPPCALLAPEGSPPGWPRFQLSALPSGAGLLLVETLLDEEKREAWVALLQPLNMLVQTAGGRERSPGEYQRLLEQHGFCQVQMVRFGGILDAILATRVGP
ncbi:hypothetical protein P7K49_039817 [Saguinus oedipus]|uniref:O-methyltransferase C-terminal domain-containing protein n=1 Tax=Saguinus oedipus TaxID=9490 RepID=A0ABQ9TCA1_SAGOE|nr:hypothetical protein P7K49_039817 [Saguinus oedipus]